MVTQGYQTQLHYGTGVDPGTATGSADTAVSGLLEVTPPSPEVDDIETSYMYSPDQFRQYEPGWGEPGEVSFTKHKDTQSSTLYGFVGDGKIHPFKVTLADGGIATFDGYLKSLTPGIDREGKVTDEGTIKVTGKPTFTSY